MYLSPLERLQLLLINFPETFLPSAQTLCHLRLFTCIVFFPSAPPERSSSLSSSATPPASLEAAHACRQWDIAFLILLTGTNIYVLFFDIHCSCSRRTAGPEWDTTSTAAKKTKNIGCGSALPPSLLASHSSTNGKPDAGVVICTSLRANRGQEN